MTQWTVLDCSVAVAVWYDWVVRWLQEYAVCSSQGKIRESSRMKSDNFRSILQAYLGYGRHTRQLVTGKLRWPIPVNSILKGKLFPDSPEKELNEVMFAFHVSSTTQAVGKLSENYVRLVFTTERLLHQMAWLASWWMWLQWMNSYSKQNLNMDAEQRE